MASLLSKLLDIVFPPHKNVIEARAINEEKILSFVAIRRYKNTSIYTALPYHNSRVRDIVKANKFYADAHSARILASVLEEMIAVVLEEHALSLEGKPILIPIPSSSKKIRERGKNQVERIIEALPKETLESFVYEKHILKRHDRSSQARIPKYMRKKNIHRAFYVPEKTTMNRSEFIILVDDVMESGSTMKDAMRALKQAGIRNIIGVALAK